MFGRMCLYAFAACTPPFLAGVRGGCVWVLVLAFTPPMLAGLLKRVCLCALSPCTSPVLAGVCGVGVCAWVPVSAVPRHSWPRFWDGCVSCSLHLYATILGSGVGPCLRALTVALHSWLGCAVWAFVLGFGFWLRPAIPGWGVQVCVFVCALRLYPANPCWGLWCVCVRSGFGFHPPLLAAVLGRVCLSSRSACTPPVLARVCSVGVIAWVRVSAAPRHSWLGCWRVFLFVVPPAGRRKSWVGFVVCKLGVPWHLLPCGGSLCVLCASRVCCTRGPLLLETCLCALVVAGGVPLWRASWLGAESLASVRSLPVLQSAFLTPLCLLQARCFRPQIYWTAARSEEFGRQPSSLWLPLDSAEAGALNSLRVLPVRGPATGFSIAGPSAVGLLLPALQWYACVDLVTQTPGFPYRLLLDGGLGRCTGAFLCGADTSPCGSEDATPGSHACVRVLVLLGRVRRAALLVAFWCASPFLWPFSVLALFPRQPPGLGCLVSVCCLVSFFVSGFHLAIVISSLSVFCLWPPVAPPRLWFFFSCLPLCFLFFFFPSSSWLPGFLPLFYPPPFCPHCSFLFFSLFVFFWLFVVSLSCCWRMLFFGGGPTAPRPFPALPACPAVLCAVLFLLVVGIPLVWCALWWWCCPPPWPAPCLFVVCSLPAAPFLLLVPVSCRALHPLVVLSAVWCVCCRAVPCWRTCVVRWFVVWSRCSLSCVGAYCAVPVCCGVRCGDVLRCYPLRCPAASCCAVVMSGVVA